MYFLMLLIENSIDSKIKNEKMLEAMIITKIQSAGYELPKHRQKQQKPHKFCLSLNMQ